MVGSTYGGIYYYRGSIVKAGGRETRNRRWPNTEEQRHHFSPFPLALQCSGPSALQRRLPGVQQKEPVTCTRLGGVWLDTSRYTGDLHDALVLYRGNVGIGTTPASKRLQVHGSDGTFSIAALINESSESGANVADLVVADSEPGSSSTLSSSWVDIPMSYRYLERMLATGPEACLMNPAVPISPSTCLCRTKRR